MPVNPTWIEPPSPQRKSGLGCFAKGCLITLGLGVLLLLVICLGSYLFYTRGLVSPQPAELPVAAISPEALKDVQQRIERFEATPSRQPLGTQTEPGSTPEPGATPTGNETPARELRLTAAEINGLIAANSKARGHAFVSMSGNTARVQISIPTAKLPGLSAGYLNGTFTLTTHGPTALDQVEVSKVQTNGWPVPSSALRWNYRGRPLLGYATEALAPYNVSQVEMRDGTLVAQ